MPGFILLCILLVLAIVFFIGFPIYKRKILAEKYNDFCKRKIERICIKNNYKILNNLDVQNYDLQNLKIDHVVFGKKFIYLINDYYLNGDVTGDKKDNSWVYYNRVKKSTHYINNLNIVGEKNIQDFAGIFNTNPDILLSISVIPNECRFSVKDANKPSSYVSNYWMVKKIIKYLERSKINDLNNKQLVEIFELIRSKNEEGKNRIID